LCTKASTQEIEVEKAFIVGGGNPRDAKLRLAQALVTLHHGSIAATQARESFLGAFSTGAMPSDAPTVTVSSGSSLVDILLEQKLVSSKTDFKRLVSNGAIKNLKDGKTIEAFDAVLTVSADLKVGKHRFLKVLVK
jgi:tyrosyl-tRNA synthetase